MRYFTYIMVAGAFFWIGAIFAAANKPADPPPKRVIVVQKAQYSSCREAVRVCKQGWRLK